MRVEIAMNLQGAVDALDSEVENHREVFEGHLEDADSLITDLEIAASEAEHATNVSKAAAAGAAQLRDSITRRNPTLLRQPYAPLVHRLLVLTMFGGEYVAGVVSIRAGFASAKDLETYGIPLGLVVGLIISAHNLGMLLKGRHAAECMAELRAAHPNAFPTECQVGRSKAWRLVTLLSGLAVIAASAAAFMVRLNQESGSPPALTFAAIALAVGVAAMGESFLWYNPWRRALEDAESLAEQRVVQAADLRARAAEVCREYGVQRGVVKSAKAEARLRLDLIRRQVARDRASAASEGDVDRELVLSDVARVVSDYIERVDFLFNDDVLPEPEDLGATLGAGNVPERPGREPGSAPGDGPDGE